MRKVVFFIISLVIVGAILAQPPRGAKGIPGKGQPQMAQRKFQIIVENERNARIVQDTNDRLLALQESSRGEAERGLLGDLLWTGFTSAFKQKTVNATSNLVSLGLNYVTEAFKSKRKKWYQMAQQQCYYNQSLSAESKIDDFYALPSTKGAMDPANLKFEGFGCKNYIQTIGDEQEGVGVFYIFCKMRRDDVGLRHIINHSKFMVELDSLVFNPRYCNLPNDSIGGADSRFSFDKRDHLNFELKVRLYSSWMNQAAMITNDQQLGEFTIKVEIDKKKLNSEGLFIYDKNDPEYEKLVSIDGDSYIVPRSYTGTTDGANYLPAWGTGQYRIEMEVSERCSIVDSYYQIREAGNGEIVANMEGTPPGDPKNSEKWKWDKAKWKVEWNAMQARRKNDSFFKNAWNCIVSAYKGTGWVATLTDPVATALYTWETQKLGEWIDDMHEKLFDSSVQSSTSIPNMNNINTSASSSTSAGSLKANGGGDKPIGNKPMSGVKP